MGPRILFMLAILALVLVGLVMVFSASTIEAIDEGSSPASFVMKQFAFAVVGALACVVCAFIPYRAWLGRLTDIAWVVAVALIALTAAIGTEDLGAQRWVNIGPVSLQPSEFAKIAFILVAARAFFMFREGGMDSRQFLVHIVVGLLLPLGALFITQSDFGTTAICAVSIIAVMWAGDVPVRAIGATLAVIGVAGFLGIVSSSYRLARMTSFLNPWGDGEGGLGTGYQLIHSFYAFAEGGLFGVGLGNSSEKFLYLPEAETDFIFAIIGEELGMLGALAVVALFLLLLFAGLRIARTAPDNFGAMLACGLVTMLVFQAFLNMACVMGVAPTTGKPLPFISSGGSSLIASFMMAGIVLSVSRASGEPDVHDQRRADLRVVRADDGWGDFGRLEPSARGGSRRSRGAGAIDLGSAGRGGGLRGGSVREPGGRGRSRERDGASSRGGRRDGGSRPGRSRR